MTTPCRSIARLVETYLDGELEPSQLLEVESHTQSCLPCAERVMLDRAIRGSVRRRVEDAKPSGELRSRVTALAIAEKYRRLRVADRSSTAVPMPGWAGWLIAATAAAAAAPLWVKARAYQDVSPSAVSAETASVGAVGFDTMIDQFVDWHARPLPPEVTNANELGDFQKYVGVPVHAPSYPSVGARLLGGRILPVREQRVAAMLQYAMQNGHRISVYVFDPERIRINPSSLSRRVVYGTEPVYMGHVRGYSVAVPERPGVGYAIASDLDDDESAELALATAPAP